MGRGASRRNEAPRVGREVGRHDRRRPVLRLCDRVCEAQEGEQIFQTQEPRVPVSASWALDVKSRAWVSRVGQRTQITWLHHA